MARTGRPRKRIDKGEFEKLCALQCTLVDIAGFFDCCEDTIEAWVKRTYKGDDREPLTFSEAYKRLSAKGKVSLRRIQFSLAPKSAAMAIFLGKNYLGQTDAYVGDVKGDGMLASLIDGLQRDGIHGEAAGADEALAGEEA